MAAASATARSTSPTRSRSSATPARIAFQRATASATAGSVEIDDYRRNVWLTDAGLDRMERELGCGSLHAGGNRTLLAELNCALHAAVLLRRGREAMQSEDLFKAVQHFSALVEHRPDFAEGWNTRATAHFRAEQYGLALDAIARDGRTGADA